MTLPHSAVTEPPMPHSVSPTAKGRGNGVALVLAVVGLAALGIGISAKWRQATSKQAAFEGEKTKAMAAAAARPSVQVTHPKSVKWRPHVEMTGTLKPWREADIGFEASGRLAHIYVQTGDLVHAGQPLAQLDGVRAGELVAIKEAAIHAQAANLAIAEDNAKRIEALAATKSVAESQVEGVRQQVALAKAQLKSAEADLNLARRGQGDNVIVAPFSGVVTKAPTSSGPVVQPGAPLVHLEDLSRFRLSATVGEDEAPLVHVGDSVLVTYRDRTVPGKVTVLVPSLDQATRRAPVEVEVANPKSEPGQNPILAWGFVRAVSQAEKKEIISVRVPPTARRPGSQDEIVKLENGKARILHVVHSIDSDGSWIIPQGLSEADVILVAPGSEIRDGDTVSDTELH